MAATGAGGVSDLLAFLLYGEAMARRAYLAYPGEVSRRMGKA